MEIVHQTHAPQLSVICVQCGAGEVRATTSGQASCLSCQQNYPLLNVSLLSKEDSMGEINGPSIIDMRQPNTVSKAEANIVEQLLDVYADVDYGQLIEIYLGCVNTKNVPDHLVQHYKNYKMVAAERGKQFAEMFLSRLDSHFPTLRHDTALELGCGSGAGMVALASKYNHVVGLDPDLPNLILAQKLCDESNLTNIQLVCAYGQSIPFPEQTFDYVSAQNVLEHVFEPEVVMVEVARVLKNAGRFVGDSRNRFDLFFPEPHVNLRWVGLLPRAWAAPYVRWRLDTDYHHTYLLSYGNLRAALKKGFGQNWRIVFPSTVPYGGKPVIDQWLYGLERIPVVGKLLLAVYPSHLAVAQKRTLRGT